MFKNPGYAPDQWLYFNFCMQTTINIMHGMQKFKLLN